MFKIKILNKGLILVGLPLVFGISFVSLLFYGLSECNRLFQHELLLKDAMIADDMIARSIFASRICAVSYFVSRDKFFEDTYSEYIREAVSSYKVLQKLLKKERFLQTQVRMLKDEIVSSNRGYLMIMHTQFDISISDVFHMFGEIGVGKFFASLPVFSLMEKLQQMTNRESATVLNAMNLLQITLVSGMIGSAVITVFLAIYFCLNISNRLLIIVNNTMSLSKGTPLQQPLEGVDEIAELDQFLFKSATEIRELERFKKEMIGIVSHELKSPLSSVGAFLSSFGAGVYGELTQKAQDKVERTHKSVDRLMGLVQELLYLDRLELEMSPEEISVDEVIGAAVDTVRELSEQSGIGIVEKSSGGRVLGDRNRLVQVIVNLLSNAMKFSPPKGTVTIQTIQSSGCFECRVSDQGRGIPEAFRKQIFEPFKQIDSKDATSKKGTGLGLTISRSIVEQHGGEIGVDSVEGEGSTFWFKIPSSGEVKLDARDLVLMSSKQGSSDPVSSVPGSSTHSRFGTNGRGRRFTVLQQGMIIISIPLIFQFGFLGVIGGLLYQVREQVEREKHSKEIVNTLNRMEEQLLVASNDGIMYVYSQDPANLKSWKAGEKAAFQLLDHVRDLSSANPKQKEDVDKVGAWLHKITGLLDRMVGLNREKELGSVTKLQEYLKKNGILEQIKPLFQGQESEEKLMAREKAIGDKLASQRLKMIKTVQLALSAGIVLNIILSICLALFMMRNLTSRLQHVMQNTARLVKREALDPPRKGSDEIAYLDQVLFETAKRLFELETFKRELISIVSHELRTPLLSISSALQLFSSGALGVLSEKGSNRLQFAGEEAGRLIRLINDLLDIEKMEAGKFVLDKSEFKVKELLKTSSSAVAQLLEMKRIKLESSDLDANLWADRDRLCQVLINLLSNAIKFSPDGGSITIAVELKSSQLEFRVIDQGKGIPEELRQKIFDRFVQVEKADASVRGGSGLGLAISKAIVEQHDGTIGVESELGAGSTFWFKIPLATN